MIFARGGEVIELLRRNKFPPRIFYSEFGQFYVNLKQLWGVDVCWFLSPPSPRKPH